MILSKIAFLQFQDLPNFGIGWVVLIIAAIVFIILITTIPMLLTFRKVFGSLKQTQTLLTTGEPAQATVLQIRDTGTTINDNPQIEVLLEVRPMNRPAYQVQTQCLVSRIKIPQVQPGALVAVRIDPQDQTKVALQLA